MIPHNRPSLGHEEEAAAARVIRTQWLAQGREVEALEAEFAAYLGLEASQAVAFSSGTAALFVALRVLGAAGKRVAHPAYVCSAIRHAARLAAAETIGFDNAPEEANVDIMSIARSGLEMAIVPHMYGIPADIAPLSRLTVIEDCAQALGAGIRGKAVSVSGTAGIFSFYATKLITTGGQGGMAVSTNASLADAFRDFRAFDQRRDDHDRFNFQMTDLQAAVGREQLRKLPGFLERRREHFEAYRRAGLDLLDIPPGGDSRVAVRYRAVVRTSEPGRIIQALKDKGISAIVPLEEWELLGSPADFPNASELCRTTVSLPLYPTLTNRELQVILAAMGNK